MGENPYDKQNDGFFDDINVEELEKKKAQEGEKKLRSKNPYQLQEMQNEGGRYEVKTKKPRSKASKILLSILLGVLIFISGGLTTWFSLGKNTRSFLKTKFLIENLYYDDVSEEDFYGVVFDAINENLLDPYSRYYTADEYQSVLEEYTGLYAGVGLTFLTAETSLRVSYVKGNSPAERAGIKAGSVITGVGRSQTEITACSDYQQFKDSIMQFGIGETFYVQVLDGETSKVLPLAREEFIENYVFYRTNQTAYRFTGKKATDMVEGGEPLSVLDDDTAYIRLTLFNGSAAKEFDKVMELFKKEGKKHLVLDLRDNGGGSMDVLTEIAKYFCKTSEDKSPLIARAIYKNSEEDFYASENVYDEYFTAESQIYVLADNGTASASECLMGCMIDYGATSYENVCLFERSGWNAEGEKETKTYGKGIMQMTLPLLFGKDALKITVAKIVWPVSGNCIHDRGILPSDGAKTAKQLDNDDMEIEESLKTLIK